MHEALRAFTTLNTIAFIALGAVALVTWRRRRDNASGWKVAAFGSLAVLELLSLIPQHTRDNAYQAITRIEIEILVVFPYLLFRFTNAFRRPGRGLARALFLLTAALIVWTLALPRIPESGEHRSPVFQSFVIVFLVHWTVLSVASGVSLWRAGRAQPSVAHRRMQFLAVASVLLAAALVLAGPSSAEESWWAVGTQLLGFVAVAGFLIGFSPPEIVRILWRAPETERFQQAMASLLTFAEAQEEVANRVLEPAARMVGARAAAVRNAEGVLVGSWNARQQDDAAEERVEVESPGATMIVWTTPYAPFFGVEELALLRGLGAVTGLALDRVRLFQAEHETRLQLERANEVKSNFIALAAHELRTPMTTIHGFVTTLHHLGDRLNDEQRGSFRESLLDQTHRMSKLIEQLLDLSRLDAEVIAIAPEPVRVRERMEEIVAAAAPES